MSEFKKVIEDIKKQGLNFYTANCIELSKYVGSLDIDQNQIYNEQLDVVYEFETEDVAKKVLDFANKLSHTNISTINPGSGVPLTSFANKV